MQAVGKRCAVCGQTIVRASEGLACQPCEVVVHAACTEGRRCVRCFADLDQQAEEGAEAASRVVAAQARYRAVLELGLAALLIAVVVGLWLVDGLRVGGLFVLVIGVAAALKSISALIAAYGLVRRWGRGRPGLRRG